MRAVLYCAFPAVDNCGVRDIGLAPLVIGRARPVKCTVHILCVYGDTVHVGSGGSVGGGRDHRTDGENGELSAVDRLPAAAGVPMMCI